MNMMGRSFSASKELRRRGVRNPDLRLKRALGDGYEADQKHIVDAHEAFANLPLILDGSIRRRFLQLTIMSGRDVNPINVRTYGNTIEVPSDLFGDLVNKLAARYRQPVPSPV